MTKKIFLITMLLIGGLFVFAQGHAQLELEVVDSKVNLSLAERNGETEIVYQPGDTLEYIIYARNIGDAVMTDPEVVDPIPDGVIYLPGSASGEDAQISFSVTEGKFYETWPVFYSVADENGDIQQREATADMITHIKWSITSNLEPGQEKRLTFRVLVK